MALVGNRPPGHPPPGMPDYDSICEEDYTYDELTDGMSTCSGSVNDILDELENVDSELADSLDLDDLTIPDVIKLPNSMNGGGKYLNSKLQRPAGSQIYGSSGHQVTKYENNQQYAKQGVTSNIESTKGNGHVDYPPVGENKNPFEAEATKDNLMQEYMSKLNNGKDSYSKPDVKKFLELADKSAPSEKCLMSEFMNVREKKFTNLSSTNGSTQINNFNGSVNNSNPQQDYCRSQHNSRRPSQESLSQDINNTPKHPDQNRSMERNIPTTNNKESYLNSNGQSQGNQHISQNDKNPFQINNMQSNENSRSSHYTDSSSFNTYGSSHNNIRSSQVSNNPFEENNISQHHNMGSSETNTNSFEANNRSSEMTNRSSQESRRSSHDNQGQAFENARRSSQTSLASQQGNYSNFMGCNDPRNSSGSPAVNSLNRNKTCPSPSFDARVFKNAKWSSTEDISFKDVGSFKDLPQTWAPRNLPSPSPDRKDFRPLNFDSNSLRRSKRSNSTDSGSVVNLPTSAPAESFAWKDSTLERQLKDLQNRKFSDPPDPKEGRQGDNDSGLSHSLDKWASKPLPKSEDPDVILLKKARQEKKVKRYLEDNFQNREGNYSSGAEYDSDIGALSSKYTSLDKRRENDRSSPPKSPPPFSKAESRYEREQRIKVGSLDSFTPGGTLSRDKSLSPPPAASSAQNRYEKERFRVQPGRIENYRIGKGSLATQEAYKAGLTSSVEACGITKYSGSHSYNPLLTSKSVSNLAIKKGGATENNHLQKTLKDGYESDSTLSYRKHHYNPGNPSPQAKALYTQVQKGGEVPLQGLRMQAPEKRDTIQRPNSSAGSTLTRDWNKRPEQTLSEEEIRMRQKQQLNKFYQDIETQKENQLKVDTESRKHHDTLLPGQKSPVPLNRYDEEDVNGNQTLFLNAGKKPSDCKMVSKAIFSFQAQNNRELSFKKGDVIYIKKQVDSNWYEGERNSNVGIFPTTYVEILPNGGVQQVNTLPKKEKTYDGAAKAKFNFTAQTPMELSLIKGETITLTRKIDNNWFEGRVGSRKGILPVAYVDIISEPGEAPAGQTKPAASPAAHSILKNGTLPQSSYIPQYEKPKSYLSASPYSTLSRPTSSLSNGGNQNNNDGKPEPIPFRALYNYKPQNDDEVELSEGDIVYVMEKCDDGWFVGTSQRTGIFGTFPGNYVTHI